MPADVAVENAAATRLLPWIDAPAAVHAQIDDTLPCDGLALAIVDTQRPQADAFICVHGIEGDRIALWCAQSHTKDTMFRTAQRRGIALHEAKGGEGGGEQTLADAPYAVLVMQPVSLAESRCWLLLLTRHQRPFTSTEQAVALLILRQWQSYFDQRGEPEVGRMLVGHDDRLLHADPFTDELLSRDPRLVERVLSSLHPVIEQRWPSEAGTHDFVVDDADEAVWVVAAKRSAITDAPDAAHWYIELRRMPDMDLPALGRIGDDRIARAVGYIHDHYHRSPSLTQVAHAVHVSPFHFHRLYTRHVGISPKQYLQRKQLQVAKWLLHATRLPVGDIAARAGFSSHGHFTSTFHRLVGVSPSEYRERN